MVRARRGHDLSRPLSALAQVLFLQAVALGGLVRYMRGDRPSIWPKLEREPTDHPTRQRELVE